VTTPLVKPAEVITTKVVQCQICKNPYPRTELNFSYQRLSDGSYFYSDYCKACEADKERQDDNLIIESRMRKLDMSLLDLIDGIADSTGGGSLVHMAECWQSICTVMGGANGLARRLLSIYMMAPPGSAMRLRVIERMYKVGEHQSVTEAAQIPLEMLNNDDLTRLHKKQAKELLLHDPDFQIKEDEDVA